MHVSIVFILEFFIKPATELTHVFGVIGFFLGGDFDELILSLLELFSGLFYGNRLCPFFSLGRQNLFLVVSIVPAPHLLEFILYAFDYLRSEVFQEGLHAREPDLIGNGAD